MVLYFLIDFRFLNEWINPLTFPVNQFKAFHSRVNDPTYNVPDRIIFGKVEPGL